MSEIDAYKAPLIAHLIELRNRLMVCVVALCIAFAACYGFADSIYGFLVQPLADSFANPESKRLIYTSLGEAFLTYMQLGLFGAFFLSFPVIATQLYLFLSPGLYKKERGVLLPYLIASPLLFLAGAALAYYYVFPLAWAFFVSFETPASAGTLAIELEARVGDYLSLVMQIIMAFGLAFQLPVLLTLLVRTGLLKTATLSRSRRYAMIIILIASALLTPPDIVSQIGLSIPLYLLYELSILCCRMIERRRVSNRQSVMETDA